MAHVKMELQTEVKGIYDRSSKTENQKICVREIDGNLQELANWVRALENNPVPIQTDDKSVIEKVVLQTIADTGITTAGEVYNINKAIFDQHIEEKKVVLRELYKYDHTLVMVSVTYREYETV